jgi:hypothetical protein
MSAGDFQMAKRGQASKVLMRKHGSLEDLLHSSAGPNLRKRVQGVPVGLILQPTRYSK